MRGVLRKPNLHKSLLHNLLHIVLDLTVFGFLYMVLVEWFHCAGYWMVAFSFIAIKRSVDFLACFFLYELYDKLLEKKKQKSTPGVE